MKNKALLSKLIYLAILIGLLASMLAIGCSSPATSTQATAPPKTTQVVTSPTVPVAAPPTTPVAPPKTTPTAVSPTTPATSATATTPKYGGTLKVIASGTIQNIGDPISAFGPDDGTFQSPAVEKLITVDPKGNIIPNLATSWTISPDNKYITMNLRKGVKFHDGTTCDAAAVKFNLDLFRTGPRPDLKTIASIDVIDDSTIRLNYATFDPALLANMWAAVGWIVSPTAYKANGADWAKTHPIGTGPYKFVSYTRDVSVKYVRFDDYWGGKPYLDAMEYDLIADPATALATFKSGAAQASIIVGTKDAAAMQSSSQYSINKIPAQVHTIAPDSTTATSPFSKLKVRQAVAYAIDTAAIAKVVGNGFYSATNQIAVPEGYSYNPSIVGYPYDPTKAKQFLSDAGYANGFNTTITFQVNPEDQDAVTAVQAYLSAVGINAKLDGADLSRFVTVYTNGWTNAMLFPMSIANSIGSDPARALLTPLSSERSRFPSVSIPADYNNLLLAANTEPDAVKRQTEFQQINKMIIDQYCMVIPVHEHWYIAIYNSQVLHDFTMNGVAPGVWYPQKAWLSQ